MDYETEASNYLAILPTENQHPPSSAIATGNKDESCGSYISIESESSHSKRQMEKASFGCGEMYASLIANSAILN